jgi:hypothetical protein
VEGTQATHVFAVVSQNGVPPVQSVSRRHCTQCCDVALHTGVPPVQRLAVQVSTLPQLSAIVPAHCVPQAAATVWEVQQVVAEEQEVLQQPLQFAAASTVSPSATHAAQFFVVSSHVLPVVQALVEQSTVPPQPSDRVPAH